MPKNPEPEPMQLPQLPFNQNQQPEDPSAPAISSNLLDPPETMALHDEEMITYTWEAEQRWKESAVNEREEKKKAMEEEGRRRIRLRLSALSQEAKSLRHPRRRRRRAR